MAKAHQLPIRIININTATVIKTTVIYAAKDRMAVLGIYQAV